MPADLQLKVFSVLSDVFWELCKCIHPSAMCHLHSLCPFSLQTSTSMNCFLCSPCHFGKVSIPQLSILLVQPVHLWEFSMEITIDMYEFLSLIPVSVSSVIAFYTCTSTRKGITDQGERRLMVTQCFVRAGGKAFGRTGYPEMRFQSLWLRELLP